RQRITRFTQHRNRRRRNHDLSQVTPTAEFRSRTAAPVRGRGSNVLPCTRVGAGSNADDGWYWTSPSNYWGAAITLDPRLLEQAGSSTATSSVSPPSSTPRSNQVPWPSAAQSSPPPSPNWDPAQPPAGSNLAATASQKVKSQYRRRKQHRGGAK